MVRIEDYLAVLEMIERKGVEPIPYEEYAEFNRRYKSSCKNFRRGVLLGNGEEMKNVGWNSLVDAFHLYEYNGVEKPPEPLSRIRFAYRNHFMLIDGYLGVLSEIPIEKRIPYLVRVLNPRRDDYEDGRLKPQSLSHFRGVILAIYLSNRDRLPPIKQAA